MDAKERLRLYLEQRRELGESELVLDSMPVDDLMALIGARSASKPSARTSRAPVSAMVPPPTVAPHDARRRDDEVAPSAPPPVAITPVEPEVRFDPSASADWRATLREQNPASPTPQRASSSPPASATSAGVPAVLPTWLSALGLPAGISVPKPTSPADELLASANTLDDVAAHLRSCQRCALHSTARNVVPGEGNPNAEFVCVGEAPGANEDEQGRPFVGDAGQLLTKILSAIQISRESVFICNVLKHRPPANRDPLPEEVLACQPFLRRQLELVKPRVILALGRFAAQTLLSTTTALGKMRGQIHLYHDIPVIVTYHPAALLRNEAWKRPTWDDVKLARRVLDAARAINDV